MPDPLLPMDYILLLDNAPSEEEETTEETTEEGTEGDNTESSEGSTEEGSEGTEETSEGTEEPLTISGSPTTFAMDTRSYAGFTPNVTGGEAPYEFSLLSGTLPTGMSLNTSTGAITGTPTQTGSFSDIVVRVTDALAQTDDLSAFTLTVSANLTISGSPTLDAMDTRAYAGFTPTVGGGTTPRTYSLYSGTLPTGMSLNTSTGAITGTPTQTGSFNSIGLRVTDSNGFVTDLATFNLTVAANLTISGSPTTTATRGVAYAGFTPTVGGGTTPRVFSLSAGSLPAGMSLNTSTGAITGTPTVSGAFNGITLRVTDNKGFTATLAPFNLTVAGATTLTFVDAVGAQTQIAGALTVTVPTVQEGDLLVFLDRADNFNGVSPTAAVPTGFTLVPGADISLLSGTNRTRQRMSYRFAPAGYSGTILTGMNDEMDVKLLLVFRPNTIGGSVNITAANGSLSNSAIASANIAALATSPAVQVFFKAGRSGNLPNDLSVQSGEEPSNPTVAFGWAQWRLIAGATVTTGSGGMPDAGDNNGLCHATFNVT